MPTGWPVAGSAPQVPELAGGWEAEEILARGLVAAFLRARPALACAPPTDSGVRGARLAEPAHLGDDREAVGRRGAAEAGDEARAALVRGCVGDGAGAEFLAWLLEMDLPDPEEVLADPAAFRLPERADRAYAALAAVTAAVTAQPSPERWAAGW